MENPTRRIVQIMPAEGWWAVYVEHDGTCIHDRVIAFALIETEDDEREVVPVTSMGDYLDLEDSDDFLGVCHADDLVVAETVFRLRAKAHLAVRADMKKRKAHGDSRPPFVLPPGTDGP